MDWRSFLNLNKIQSTVKDIPYIGWYSNFAMLPVFWNALHKSFYKDKEIKHFSETGILQLLLTFLCEHIIYQHTLIYKILIVQCTMKIVFRSTLPSQRPSLDKNVRLSGVKNKTATSVIFLLYPLTFTAYNGSSRGSPVGKCLSCMSFLNNGNTYCCGGWFNADVLVDGDGADMVNMVSFPFSDSKFKTVFTLVSTDEFLHLAKPTSTAWPRITGGWILASVKARTASFFNAYLTKPILTRQKNYITLYIYSLLTLSTLNLLYLQFPCCWILFKNLWKLTHILPSDTHILEDFVLLYTFL